MWVQTQSVSVRTVGSDHSHHTKQSGTGRAEGVQGGHEKGRTKGEIVKVRVRARD